MWIPRTKDFSSGFIHLGKKNKNDNKKSENKNMLKKLCIFNIKALNIKAFKLLFQNHFLICHPKPEKTESLLLTWGLQLTRITYKYKFNISVVYKCSFPQEGARQATQVAL